MKKIAHNLATYKKNNTLQPNCIYYENVKLI